MKAGDSIHGFKALSVREVPEYRCSAVHLVHGTTGCEVLHLVSGDRENTFAFSFTTPPRDDTGMTHIAEHSVLAGSRRFPLKDPFAVLMKGSMHTFLNAFTYPDRTIYPSASLSRADFFNLMLVYGDAVFFPLFRRETFMQEAWRLEEAGDALRYAGIVYNEMKGAYSSPEAVVSEWALRSLFPDTPYGFDSGGDPRAIPSLTLDGLREYHGRYYHPSNCRVFLHGNIPTEESLEFLQRNFLGSFTAAPPAEPLPLQRRWSSPRRLEKTYPVRPGGPSGGKSTVCASWLSVPVTDAEGLLAMEIVSEILVGSPGSPLRKRLVESGLGEDLSPSGLETELRETVFTVGLRGTDPARETEIIGLVDETMGALSRGGVDRGLVESTVNRVEFRNREIRSGGGPYSLRLLRRALRGWVHGTDPVESLVFTPVMERVKKRIAGGLLEQCIARELVSNPHRATLVVSPDEGQEEREAGELAARLASVAAGLSREDRARLSAEGKAFAEYQRRDDTPEDLARIPRLARGDLPAEVERVPSEEERIGETPLVLHDVFTNDVVYVDLCFPVAGLGEDLQALLPLFCKAVTGSGLPGKGYDQVAVELLRHTGGFYAFVEASGIAGDPASIGQHVFFRVRALRHSLGPAMDLVRQLLTTADFRDTSRLRDLALEMRNDARASLVPGGNYYASLRAAAMLSAAARREETWKGVTQLLSLQELGRDLEGKLGALAGSLEAIRAAVLRRGGLTVNLTAARECFGEARAVLASFCGGLPGGMAAAARPALPAAERRTESLVTSATVGYVARAIEGFRIEDERSAAQAVLGHLLSTGFLWETVRMEGGAYGASASARSMDGVFVFSSYRDPHIVRTLRAFRESLSRTADGAVDAGDVDRAVIGIIGRDERPLDPGEKGFVALQRRLYGLTDELRQARRTQVLGIDGAALAGAARSLLGTFDRGVSVILSHRAAVDAASREMAELAESVREIPD
jgi:presequence protease